MSNGITVENLLRTLPSALQNDANMQALASSIANILAARPTEVGLISIYTQIDSLPKELLDLLAYDFKVDWYGYDYGVEAKRALIKDSFNVHKLLGTKGAVEKALSGIYPGSTVEEWFNYGGDPFYFRVLCDVTEQRVSITHSEIVKAINIYKSLRSHLEGNAVIYRSRVYISLGVISGYVVYAVRQCGTFPVTATQGEITACSAVLGSDGHAYPFTMPSSGTENAGSFPSVAMQGEYESGSIGFESASGNLAYSTPVCGTELCGSN